MKRSKPPPRHTPLRSTSPGPTRQAWINRTTKPLAKVGKQKAKRQAKNAEYYRSAEWRAKKKAVHARDDYQCAESVVMENPCYPPGVATITDRCPNRGEIVNGKQTARGLVAEEVGYFHRGNPDSIDRIVTRCRECDRRLTPQERINHSNGFHNSRSST